jgi:hypothetical protein
VASSREKLTFEDFDDAFGRRDKRIDSVSLQEPHGKIVVARVITKQWLTSKESERRDSQQHSQVDGPARIKPLCEMSQRMLDQHSIHRRLALLTRKDCEHPPRSEIAGLASDVFTLDL